MSYGKDDVYNAIYADAYLRYSDKKQDELSIEYQMEEVQEYADKNGITIRTWYIDRAKSAKKVAGRDEFYKYVDTVRRGTCAPCLLVWRTNRAFRNSYESHIYRKLLREKNIKLLSATQQIDEDTSSGRLVTNILADIDQYKSEEIGDHVTAASRSLVKRNPRVYMGQLPIFGYKVIPWKDGNALRQEYAVNDDEKPIVQQIFRDFINGQSLYNIAAWLNSQGYKTRRGHAWSYQTLRELIKNDFYKGTRSYMRKSDDPLIFENAIDAIIDPVTWENAQKQFRKAPDGAGGRPRRQKNGRVYGLTGKVFCGICGKGMCGKGGKDYRYYVCFNMEARKTCTCKRVRKEMLEQYVLEQIRLHLLNVDMIDHIVGESLKIFNAMPSPLEDAEKSKAKKNKLVSDLANLAQMKLDGEITPEVYIMMKAKKENELKEIEKELIFLESVIDVPTETDIRKQMHRYIKDVNAANINDGEMLKSLFDQFVHEIIIDNESVGVTLSVPLSTFSHKLPNGSPVFTLCQNAPYSVLKPQRVPFEKWDLRKRKRKPKPPMF